MSRLTSILALILAALPLPAVAAEFYCLPGGAGTGTGSSWGNASSNLMSTLTNAASGDVVYFSGSWTGAVTVSSVPSGASARYYVPAGVTLQGATNARLTTAAIGATRILVLETNAAVRNAAIHGGLGPSVNGGNVFSMSDGCLVYDCDVYGSPNASGVYRGTVVDSRLYGNAGGGAILATLSGSEIYTNSAASGGGVSSCVASNCLIRNNTAGNLGGGALESVLIGCTVVSNVAAATGGGTYLGTNFYCTIAYNVAATGGGGTIFSISHSSIVAANAVSGAYTGGGVRDGAAWNCTIVSNSTAAATGGGMYNATASNSIVLYNTAAAAANYAQSNFYNGTIPSGIYTNPIAFGEGFRLPAGSPAIDAGNNTASLSPLDALGQGRVNGATVDYGAVEWYADPVPASTARRHLFFNIFGR